MNSSNINLFKKVSARPRWEGIVFADLDFSDDRISISAAEPAPELQEYIESIWYMRWDLVGKQPVRGIQIPNPCTKLVTLRQNGQTYPPIFVGVNREAEFFELSGAGTTVGFDFKPGGIYHLLGKSMRDWPTREVQAKALLAEIRSPAFGTWTELSLSAWVSETQRLLIAILESPIISSYSKILPIVTHVIEGTVHSPEEMAQVSNCSMRSLQRIFKEEVGISPRDLLRIARFNDAIRKISDNDFKSFADTALASGFFDQPHMANEFQKLVNSPTSKFRRYL